MADFITPVIDILSRLCGCCANCAVSIRNLGENLNSLRNDSNQLNSRYLDVKMKVETAEKNPDPELTVLNEVRDWMGKVEDLQNKVQNILQQGNQEIQAKCFGGRCPKNCWASYKLHKKVTQKLSDVNDLISKGHFEVVVGKFARDRFNELPVEKALGVESTFEELRSCFENRQVGIIGLYGMGGVGKTTLLKKFNNDFLSKIPHCVVIWVVASKDVDPGKIQDAIRKKLRVQDDIWNNETEDNRALLLYNILNKKKFVLLLDDVWQRIDLLKLGVPSPKNHDCKIIFTTRSYELCGQMDAHRPIKVNCLASDKAFDLFKEKVGETTLENPYILPLAKQVVKECQGLPLALCTVGRAMANKVTPNEWNRAIELLRSYPSKVQGIVDDVYHLLEFSYDRLSNSCKSCFLYCALFPEDYNIPKEDLIFLWIAEGFVTEFDHDIHEARKEGEDIISSLKYACLLEDEGEGTVKMHDVIRDMALWVACGHGKKTTFLVKDHPKASGFEVYDHAKGKEVEKLSMWGRGGTMMNFSQIRHCPNLVTLLIREAEIQDFLVEVFVLPSTIRVLDFSNNDGLTYLPSVIGDFVNLEYLNISLTSIKKLPEELKNLKQLRFLLLDNLEELELPIEVISSLLSLQAFSLVSTYSVGDDVVLHELDGLERLQYIRISVSGISSVKKILNSSKLQRCMCALIIEGISSLLPDLFSSIGKMEHLESLAVVGGKRPENSEAAYIPRSSFSGHEHIIILRSLVLLECHTIIDLNWLILAPNLEFLALDRCDSLVEVISEEFGTTDTERVKSNLFRSLIYLHLTCLRNLRSICRTVLQFSCLERIEVTECPNLKTLPFNSQSALENLELFEGDFEWLNQLQWEDEATKHLLSSKFKSVEVEAWPSGDDSSGHHDEVEDGAAVQEQESRDWSRV